MKYSRIPVQVRWYKPEERGRKIPPPGPRYFATIQKLNPINELDSWSIVLDGLQNTGYQGRALMSFISDQAPAEDFRTGESVLLFEGRWPVAEARVLEPVHTQA